MASTPTSFAILRQLDATLQLITALSSSLTVTEIMEIRQGLARAYNGVGIVLERNLEIEGVTSVCEFRNNFLDPSLTLFQ